ncbi:MAG: Hsp20/alpha crystallin family protein [Desulfuromonadales bacterium]|nr:Hsp20/alpha crystallin family protein [Desulfuromonadales bacterium]
MATQEMVERQETTPAQREETRTIGRVMTPAVDIFESDDSLTLMADMPGVAKEDLNINLEKGILTINGEVKLERPGKIILREFMPSAYYRQFKLSEHIDAEKSTAELVNGVLTLHIPKAESAKPKKIEIKH